MRILFLAPQPFFQERGTPIAVRLALKVIAERQEDRIDLLTFAEGEDVEIPNVQIHRIWSPFFLRGVRPGFSIKKLFCDPIFFVHAAFLILKAKLQGKPYALVHAVEESVFMALVFRYVFFVPYIYDMDSSLAIQLTEKLPWLKILKPFFEWLEARAIRSSIAVIPVCDALAVIAQNQKASHIQVLPDISLTSENETVDEGGVNLNQEIGVADSISTILYVGNLEHYQGVELLVDSFCAIADKIPNWHLVVVGGAKKHIDLHKEKVANLQLSERVHLIGTRPVSKLGLYLKEADILASPRILGNNTPMKIYSYMHSEVAIIATALATHTQVLTAEMALLVEPNIENFSNGLLQLTQSSELRERLAKRAFDEAEAKYTFPVFKKTLLGIYQRITEQQNFK